MSLSIIIVNYKTPQLLLDCISSVYRHDCIGMEIIVIDNYSNDDTESLLKTRFPEVIFLQMGYNAGFARANNAGIKMARGAVILMLNSDTIVEGNAISNNFKLLVSSEEYVACGVQLLNADKSPQISGNYAMKGGLNYLLPLPYLGNFLKILAFLMKVKKPNVPEAEGMVEVDWINGAYFMVKKSAIDMAGYLDEDFFLYAEEAEWCSRLKKYGKLFIDGTQHVTHLQGQTANDAFNSTGQGYFNLFDKKGQQIMLSNFVRIRKEFGLGWFFFHLCIFTLEIPIFILGLIISKIFKDSKSRYSFVQWKGYCKNVWKIFVLTPIIISNKPYFYKVL